MKCRGMGSSEGPISLSVPRLTLRITNMAGLPEGFPLAHRTEGKGFQIGRNPAMAWVLPDPEKRISGEHLRVHYHEGAYWLQDVSKNGTLVNGRPLAGMRRLSHDDLIGIGHYRIAAEVLEDPPDYGFARPPLPLPDPVTVLAGKSAPLPAPVPPSPHQALLAGIARGAGLEEAALAAQDPGKLGYEIGQSLRIMAEQMIRLLASRASTKRRIRSRNRTLLAAGGNNPLKASLNAEAALEQLFIQRSGFFLAAPEALSQGFADLGQHQNASYEAMQAALARMLGELAPETVEARARGGIFPSKAARAWARYTRDWDARTLTHDQGMMDVFLAYFAQAYDQVTEKLVAEKLVAEKLGAEKLSARPPSPARETAPEIGPRTGPAGSSALPARPPDPAD